MVDVSWDTVISNEIVKNGGKLLALNNSVVNHIGKHGLWSTPGNFDFTSTF